MILLLSESIPERNKPFEILSCHPLFMLVYIGVWILGTLLLLNADIAQRVAKPAEHERKKHT
jgi:hypothetical protein